MVRNVSVHRCTNSKIKCFPTQWKISSIGGKCMKSILLSCLKEKSTETTCILRLLPNPCYEVNPMYLPQPPTWLLRSLLLTKGRDLQRWPRWLCSLPPGHRDLASAHSAVSWGRSWASWPVPPVYLPGDFTSNKQALTLGWLAPFTVQRDLTVHRLMNRQTHSSECHTNPQGMCHTLLY